MSAGSGKSGIDYNWLAVVPREDGEMENDFGSEEFEQLLVGKLTDLTGASLGPGAWLHYNNVAIAYTHLYGFDIEGLGANAALVTRSGNQGSVAELRVPAAAGMLQKTWNIVVGPELTWSAEATTTDYASESKAVTARNALKYYWEHEGVSATMKTGAFYAMGMGECGFHAPWDETLGQDMSVSPDGQRILKSGDATCRRIPTWDILRDPSARSHAAHDWIVVREWPSKYDVAAMCDDEDAKEAALSSSNVQAPVQGWAPWQSTRQYVQQNGDRIPVYYLYAKRTPSCPTGRQTIFLNDGTIVRDGPLDERYVNLPPECIGAVVVMRAGEYDGTCWPYTKFSAALGAGQARDGLKKDLLTNATAMCGPVVAAPSEAMDVVASTQLGGPRVVPMPPGTKASDIQVLQFTSAHPDHFKLDATLGNEQQQILGLDAITAGSADISKTLSGAAMALMTSTSVQNNSQWQSAYAKASQAVGCIFLRHIQRMSVPKRIALAGVARSALVTTTQVSGDDVQGIERVLVTIGAPLEQSDAGRYEIAKEAMDKGWVKTPEQFQEVRDTGRLDALSEDLSMSLLTIRGENEALAKGEDVPVMVTDDHRLHIKRHAAVTASLTARMDPRVVTAQQAHVDWHVRMLRETDPVILESTGQAPVGMPMGPPGGGMPPPSPSPQAGAQEAGPSLPTNPSTGEEQGPAAGAMPPSLAVKPANA